MEERLRPVIDMLHDFWMYISIGVLLFLLGITRHIVHRGRLPTMADRMKDITMTVEGRRKYVEMKAFEAVCEALLIQTLDGELTDEEANALMVLFAKNLNQEATGELIRKKKSVLLKAQLRNNNRRRILANGKRKTAGLPIPEPKSRSRKPVQVEEDDDSLASLLK